MENIQKLKVGTGILTLSIIQLVFSGFVLIGLIITLFTKDTLKTAGVATIPTYTLIIDLVFIIIITLSIILILMKKALGIYIYFIAQVANVVYSIVSNGFKPVILISLIIPVLMGIFICKKKEVYVLKAKA